MLIEVVPYLESSPRNVYYSIFFCRDGEQKVLTDIMGMEDFLGDMDFKFSATR